jgi:hypothetical protein
MNALILGKILETIGAICLAWVGFRVGILEFWIGRHLLPSRSVNVADSLEELRLRLKEEQEFRRRQFGQSEAVMIAAGTGLIALGSLIYLYGLLSSSH